MHEIAHALVGPSHGHDAVWRQRLEKLDVLLLVAIILIFTRRAGLCNVQMAVFRWSVIAVNQALFVNANQPSNLLPANMDIDRLFELNATRLGQCVPCFV